MNTPSPIPDRHDTEALRQWLRTHRRPSSARPAPRTPEELTAAQRNRLMSRFGAQPADLSDRRRLDLALTGSAIRDHTVRLDLLGPFLDRLQKSVTAVAQALGGRPTDRAPFPRGTVEATTLSAVATFPSSFGVVLYGPPVDTDEGSTIPRAAMGDPRTLLDEAVETVLDIVDLSEGAGQSDDLLADKLVPLGPRALSHMGALTKMLTESDAGLRLEWHAGRSGSRQSRLNSGGARRVHHLCEESTFDEPETTTVRGWLGGASAFRGYVEIRTEGRGLVRARTDETVTPHLADHFGHHVEAEIEVTTVRYAGGRQRSIYTVLSLRNV